MYDNPVLPVQHLRKTLRIKPGGLCRILFFKWEDVITWPAIDPQDGVIYDPVVLKEDAVFFVFEPNNERNFTEEQKESSAGPFIEVQVNGKLAGNTLNYITSLDAMIHHRFGLLITDRNGEIRLIGDEDSGAIGREEELALA